MTRPFFPMLFLIAQQRSFWCILFGGWSFWDKTCGAKSASWNATKIAGHGLQHRVRAQTLRRADVGFVGGRKVQYQMGENWRLFSYITYGESEWGWSSSWYWDTKKKLNWWDTPMDCGVPYLPDFQTRTYEKLEKKGAIAMAHMRHSFANA